MPAITIQSLELSDSQKRILAKKFVETFAEITNVPKDRVYLFFDGYTLDNVGTGGIRFSDKPTQRAWGKFNEDEWSKDPEIVKKLEEVEKS
ncbi:MAG: tautomerase family protein [Selenomonadaceae bacterium]|nr:tautomerase family protein [Selenomonadaceae bacterium]